jgi:catechol 2,3-dioxygenase-like lactoylglutathione lyase family enzyme
VPTRPSVGLIPPHAGSGRLHLFFSISRGDLAHWYEHLTGCGLRTESPLDWPGGDSSLYFRDPDGHLIEVATAGLWQNDRDEGYA